MKKGVKVAGICPLYNVLSAQYPFVEAIITTLPLVDVLFVNDGGSTDGTLKVLRRMAERWPKIVITQIKQEKSQFWENIDQVLMSLINNECQGYDWIIEIQADEFFHPSLYQATLDEIERAHVGGYNSIRQPITTIFRWTSQDDYVYRNVRIFRNMPNIISRWGGDCFFIKGLPEYREGFSAHNMPPELDSNVLRHHLKDCFARDRLLQAKNHAEFFATEQQNRRDAYQMMKKHQHTFRSPPKEQIEIHPEIPEIFHGLVGLEKYEVREELFEM